jgi:hypothetical protein
MTRGGRSTSVVAAPLAIRAELLAYQFSHSFEVPAKSVTLNVK